MITNPVANQILQAECATLIDDDFKQEIQSAIKSRVLWQKLTKVMDVGSHLLQGTTTILAFMSAAASAPVLSVVAGCAGVGATVCMSYSMYCKNQYNSQTKIIESMCSKINVVDILPDNSSELVSSNNLRGQLVSASTPASTPAATPAATPASTNMLTAYTNSSSTANPTASPTERLAPLP